MTASRRLLLAALAAALLTPRLAAAACPDRDPGDSVCEPFIAFLMPSAAGAAYFPHAAGGPYFGGGVELALLSWSNNSDVFGPSQGRVRATFTYLAGPEGRTAALYRFGGLVSVRGQREPPLSHPLLLGEHRRALRLRPRRSRRGGRVARPLLRPHAPVRPRRRGRVRVPVRERGRAHRTAAQLTASFALW